MFINRKTESFNGTYGSSFCFYDETLHARTDKYIVQLQAAIQDQSILLNKLLNMENMHTDYNTISLVKADYRPIQLDELRELDSRNALLHLLDLIKKESLEKHRINKVMIDELDIRVVHYSDRLEGMIRNFRSRELSILDENEYLKNQVAKREHKFVKEVEKFAEERGSIITKIKQLELQKTQSVDEVRKTERNYQDSIETLKEEKNAASSNMNEEIDWFKKNSERLENHVTELTEIVSMNRSTLDDKDEQVAGLNDRIQQLELALKDKFAQLKFQQINQNNIMADLSDRENEVINLKQKVSNLMNEQESIEQNVNELEKILNDLRKENQGKDGTILSLNKQLDSVNMNFSCNVNDRDESLAILTVENEELGKQLSNCGIFINQMKKERAR